MRDSHCDTTVPFLGIEMCGWTVFLSIAWLAQFDDGFCQYIDELLKFYNLGMVSMPHIPPVYCLLARRKESDPVRHSR